jgi:hypothetical protein
MPKEFFGKHKRRRRKHVALYQSAPRNMSGPDQRYNTFDREAHRELDMGSSRAHTFFKDPDIQPGQAPREPTSSSYLGATEDFSSSSMELDVSVAYEQELQSQGKGDNTCNVTGLDEEDATLCIPETPEAVKKKLFGSQEEIISQSFQHKPSSLHENEFASDSLPSRIREASSTAMHSSKAPNNIPGQGSWQIKPIFNVISSFINQNSRHAEPMADSSQTPNRGVDEDLSLLEKLQNKERELERSKKKYNKLIDSHQKLQQTAQLMEKWVAEFESKNQRLLHEKKQQELKFRGEIRESRAELDLVQEKYEELIRKRQEEAFKQMRSGRWLPTEDGKVVAELARVKREIRTWARSMATTDIKFLERLDETELMGLLANLSHVAVVQHADLPRGLGTPKAPGLLLNALLAHHVCTTTFQSPFFFLDDRLEEESLGAQGARLLGEMYKAAQDCKLKSCSHEQLFANFSSQRGRCACLAKSNSTNVAPGPREKRHSMRKRAARKNRAIYRQIL